MRPGALRVENPCRAWRLPQINGPPAIKITEAKSVKTPVNCTVRKRIQMHTVEMKWSIVSSHPSVDSTIVHHTIWKSSMLPSAPPSLPHPFSCIHMFIVMIVMPAICMSLTTCSRVIWFNLLIWRTALSSFFSLSPGTNNPINLPRKLRLSPPSLLVFKSPGLILVFTLCTVKMPLRKRFCKKNCLIWMCFSLPVPLRRMRPRAEEESRKSRCWTFSLLFSHPSPHKNLHSL